MALEARVDDDTTRRSVVRSHLGDTTTSGHWFEPNKRRRNHGKSKLDGNEGKKGTEHTSLLQKGVDVIVFAGDKVG